MKVVVFMIVVGVTLVNCQRFVQDTFQGEQSFAALPRSFAAPTTPAPVIPIIKHINRVNEDGSYTFGYESGDGSFRVETRGIDGITRGKYGYLDEQGRRKEVDYLAGSDTGYEPSGQGITVPPRPPPRPYPIQPDQYTQGYDDGSYRPQEHDRPRVAAGQRVQFAAAPARAPLSAPAPTQSQLIPQIAQRPIAFPSFSAQPAPAPQVHQFQPQSFHQQQAFHQSQPVAIPNNFQSQRPSSSSSSSSLPVHSHAPRVGGPSPIDAFLGSALSG